MLDSLLKAQVVEEIKTALPEVTQGNLLEDIDYWINKLSSYRHSTWFEYRILYNSVLSNLLLYVVEIGDSKE